MIKKLTIFSIVGIFLFAIPFLCNSFAGELNQRKSISHTYPKTYSEWENGFFAGNGKMGVIVFGNPLDETIIYNDRKFFMAASRERTFNQVSETNLKKIRDYCADEKWKEANDLANAVHGWQDGGEGNKHPGFEMLISIEEDGEITNYARECDFRTGEITVKWKDNRGDWERKTFVSRKDNVIVQYLTAPSNGNLTCSVRLDTDPGMHLDRDMKFTNVSDINFLNLRVNYPSNTNGAGYEGVSRIVSDGEKSIDGNTLTITNATYIMLLTQTERYYSDCENEWEKKTLQAGLALLPTDYDQLLSGQIETHQSIYDRVKLDLGGDPADKDLTNEELLQKQKESSSAVVALWERIFDAGRYHYLSSSSDVAPPDLLGLWTGDSNVGWSGYYHLDANVNLQIGGGNIGAMPEAMEGYFTFIERLSDGFKTNASKLLGCRGMLGGGNTAGLNGLISALNYYYPYQYVTGEMGWLLYPFWEHYQVTGDKDFLRDRLYPLMKEMGYFYEDFLVRTDTDGKYIFAGSISPENQPRDLNLSLVNNSTFDIAGAKFCLEKLIEICNMFEYEQGAGEGVERWSAILEKLPAYLINSDGALSEWSWPGLKENYGHRHSSHLITVWPLNEISKEKTPDLYVAAQKALNKKDEHQYEGAGHGIIHAALHAANLNNDQSVNAKILRLIKEDFYYPSLATAHYANFNVFCTDVAHTVPNIMMEMLVNSKNDVIELLPAIPQTLKTGSLSGIKTRNRATIEKLEWNLDENLIRCFIKSDIDQDIRLIQRRGITAVSGNVKTKESSLPNEFVIISLKAGESTEIILEIEPAPAIPENLALGKEVVASSVADNCPPENVNDENPGTRWSSEYTNDQWIYIDLGKKKNITGVKLIWEAAYGRSYKLQVSDDAKNWEDIYTQTSGTGGEEIISLSNTAGRYVRLQGLTRATEYGYSLWEFEIYGTDEDTSIMNLENNRLVELFPNLENTVLYIKSSTELDVHFFDLKGAKVISLSNIKDSINISSLDAGTYIIQFECGKKSYTEKFIKY